MIAGSIAMEATDGRPKATISFVRIIDQPPRRPALIRLPGRGPRSSDIRSRRRGSVYCDTAKPPLAGLSGYRAGPVFKSKPIAASRQLGAAEDASV